MKILTPAKINLTLEIVGKRSDGYHDLATWMLPVGLCDTLEICVEKEQSFAPALLLDIMFKLVRIA